MKKQTVIRKTIVVDDDGNVIEDENILKSLRDEATEKSSMSKKDD